MSGELGRSRDVDTKREKNIDFLRKATKRRESTLSETDEYNKLQREISAIAEKKPDGDPASLKPHVDLIARVWGEDDSRVKELRKKFQDLLERDEQLAEVTKGYDGKPKDPERAISTAAARFLDKHELKPVMLLYIERLQKRETVFEHDEQAQELLKECTSLSAEGYIKYINEEVEHFYGDKGKIDQKQGKERQELIGKVAAHMECALAYYHNYKDFLSRTNDNYGGKPKDPEHAISTALTHFLNKHELKSVMLPYIERLQKDKQVQTLLKECTSLSAEGYIKYINEEVQHFYDNQGKIAQTQGKKKLELIVGAAVHIECALAYHHNYKAFLLDTDGKIDEAKKIYSELLEDINRSLKEIESSIDNIQTLEVKGEWNTSEETLIGAATLPQKEGKTNEDAHFFDEKCKIAGVFDGAGDSKGHLASSTACEYIRSRASELSDDLPEEDLKEKMKEILLGAHKAIRSVSGDARTTASMVKITIDRKLIIGNAADSRIYLYKGETQELIQITVDSIYGSDFLKKDDEFKRRKENQKRIAELETFENVSEEIGGAILETKYPENFLGSTDSKKLDPAVYELYEYDEHQLEPGDIIVLMSDGISKNLPDSQIRDCVLKNLWSPREVANALVKEAHDVGEKYYKIEDRKERRKQRCSPDDMTAIAIKV